MVVYPPFYIIDDRYLVIIHGDIEPELIWYVDEESRDLAAIEHRRKDGERDDGLFKLDISGGIPRITTYSNSFFYDALGKQK